MSFVGLGGLGHEIRISLDDLAYQQVWTYLLFLIGLVLIVDIWSTMVRRRLSE
jgi:phosphonate transport system permease protein